MTDSGCSIRRILIANRGEIACRIVTTAKRLGVSTVAVASDPDRDARHARMADITVEIGGEASADSYLVADKILEAARHSGADAIHPGYGFLSENAAFAEAVIEAGLRWIGPPPAAIAAMGDKASSKRLMIAASVPCVPGYQGEAQDDRTLLGEAERVGYPLMVKASAGGGGKGMRIVRNPSDTAEAIAAARSEAARSFGSDHLILERAILDARHVEIQVFADALGNVVHLGERDCSVQRRHQKIIEECPSPAVDAGLRERMGAAATAAARAVGYVGAGTVEFLLGPDGEFYFLEMNTRLQVEHPVTELVYGVDLVEWQLRIAEGDPLPLTQAQIVPTGAAIEARLYAESPASGFLPRTGKVIALSLPAGDGIRIDHGLRAGSEISAWYDPMLAKIVAAGPTRRDALRKLSLALQDTFLAGCETNRSFLLACLGDPEFASGDATTAFIERRFGSDGPQAVRPTAPLLALAALLLGGGDRGWASSGTRESRLVLGHGDERQAVLIRPQRDGGASIALESGETIDLAIIGAGESVVRYSVGGLHRSCRYAIAGNHLYLASPEGDFELEDLTRRPPELDEGAQAQRTIAPMAGIVTSLQVQSGDEVIQGQLLLVLEAMKMEHRIIAPRDGVIEAVHVQAGSQVAARTILVELVDDQ